MDNNSASPKKQEIGSTRESRRHTPKASTAGLYSRAIRDAFYKLNPRIAVRNPVMFMVWVGSLIM